MRLIDYEFGLIYNTWLIGSVLSGYRKDYTDILKAQAGQQAHHLI